MSDDLDAAMMAAHEAHDTVRLVGLYRQAAASANDLDAACFYLTHAYVFALEAGLPEAREIRALLMKHGRETDVTDPGF